MTSTDLGDSSQICVKGVYCIMDTGKKRFFEDQYWTFAHDYYARVQYYRGRFKLDVLSAAQYAEALWYACGLTGEVCQSDLTNELQSLHAVKLAEHTGANVSPGALGAVVAGMEIAASTISSCRYGGGAGKRSFAGRTEVLMADGTVQRIDSLKPGDKVLAADPETGERGPRAIERVWVHDDDLFELTTNVGALVTTEDHPFWNATKRQWQRADELALGDQLGGTSGPVAGGGTLLVSVGRRAAAYNLTVSDIHTYYVLAGDAPVLVHNCPMKSPRQGPRGRAVKMPGEFGGVDIGHTRSGHTPGGERVQPGKNLWPDGTTDAEITSVARQLFGNNPRVTGFDPDTNMIRARGQVNGKTYEMIVNRGTGEVRSVYPKS